MFLSRMLNIEELKFIGGDSPRKNVDHFSLSGIKSTLLKWSQLLVRRPSTRPKLLAHGGGWGLWLGFGAEAWGCGLGWG